MDDYQHKHYDEQRQSKISEVSIQDLKNDINVKTSNVRHGSVTLALWLNGKSNNVPFPSSPQLVSSSSKKLY